MLNSFQEDILLIQQLINHGKFNEAIILLDKAEKVEKKPITVEIELNNLRSNALVLIGKFEEAYQLANTNFETSQLHDEILLACDA